jgi:hypothetical protein
MGSAPTGRGAIYDWREVVMTMSYSGAQKAWILRTARRNVRDKNRVPGEPPSPEPPSFEIKFEGELERWKREADEFEAQRKAADAKRKREERADEAARLRAKQNNELEARVGALEERMSAVEQALAAFNSVADGAAQFSSATVARLEELATLANKVDAALTTMRAVHRREVDALRDRLASSEAMHARETALLVAKLSDAQREIDRRADIREHARTRMQVAGVNENLENVVALVREDIASRN